MENYQFRLLSSGEGDSRDTACSTGDILEGVCNQSRNTPLLYEVKEIQGENWFPKQQNPVCTFSTWAFKVGPLQDSDVEDAEGKLLTWLKETKGDLVIFHKPYGQDDIYLLCFTSRNTASAFRSVDHFLNDDVEKHDHHPLLDKAPMWRSSIRTVSSCSFQATILVVLCCLLLATTVTTGVYLFKPVREFDPTCQRIKYIHTEGAKILSGSQTSPSADSNHGVKNPASIADSHSQGEYIEFPTPEANTGPRHQKYLLPTNISSFELQHDISNDFYLRMDDQALVRLDLVDQHEKNVQAWFATNFPILAEVRDSGKYLDNSFLDYASSSSGPQRLLLNERYHIAHCTTAWRRYLRALKKGKHVCPRDLDLDHLDHCTRQLESFAFRPRETWGTGPEIDVADDRFMDREELDDPSTRKQVMLTWHTDVCY